MNIKKNKIKIVSLILVVLIIFIYFITKDNRPEICKSDYSRFNNKVISFISPEITSKMGVSIDVSTCSANITYVTKYNFELETNSKYLESPYLGYVVEHKIINESDLKIGLEDLLPIYNNQNSEYEFDPSKYASLKSELKTYYGNESKTDKTNNFYSLYTYTFKIDDKMNIAKLLSGNTFSIFDGRDFIINGDNNLPYVDKASTYTNGPKIREIVATEKK